MEFDLSSEFVRAVREGALSLTGFILKYQFMHATVIPATALIASYLATHKAAKAIQKGRMDGHLAIFGETIYTPTGEINPATGLEFYDQKIRNYKSINLEEIFHPKARKVIIKYLDKASRYCTQDEPIVFQHLHKVIHPKKFDQTWEVLRRQWVNFFSGLLNDSARPQSRTLKGREYFEEETKIPLLVKEQTAQQKQYRVLLVSLDQLAPEGLPLAQNTRIQRNGEFVYDPGHYHMERLVTCWAMADAFNSEPHQRFRELQVNYATGNVKTVPHAETRLKIASPT